ncbi:tail fiber domain-containing protein, partial [Candidatus Woesearchaeota archaeon]|nr:tail fiber domain-containing protein [Candidatus Woesearchaeota archaeon]
NIFGILGRSTDGVYGQYDSNRYGWIGSSSQGVYGQYDGSNYGSLGLSGYGVSGLGSSRGVYGVSSTMGVEGYSGTGIGVKGSGAVYGVEGRANSGGYAVFANSSNNNNWAWMANGTYGVYGRSIGQVGVYGVGGASGVGVVGSASPLSSVFPVNTGVYGEATDYGVYGNSTYGVALTFHAGVFGQADLDGYGAGVVGTVDTTFTEPTTDYGVYGSYNENYYGFLGSISYGVYGSGPTGVYGTYYLASENNYGSLGTSTSGVYGYTNSSSSSDAGVRGVSSGTAHAGYFYGGNVMIGSSGTINSATGTGDLYVQDVIEADGIYGVTGTGYYVRIDADGTFKANSASSRRYKTNITEMENIDWIYSLRPVNFEYKVNDEGKIDENGTATGERDYGIIAEEMEEVNPSFVMYNTEGQVDGVDYPKLIPVLLKSLQEQKDINDKQEETIEQLKIEIENLKKR